MTAYDFGYGYRWRAPDGRLGAWERTPQAAAEAAILKALAARPVAPLEREVKAALWRALRAKGWAVQERRPTWELG